MFLNQNSSAILGGYYDPSANIVQTYEPKRRALSMCENMIFNIITTQICSS